MVLVLCAVGCRTSGPLDSGCRWPTEGARPLELHHATDQRHLAADAARAEGIAIRYSDTHAGLRSGHFVSWAAYGAARDSCMAQLFATISAVHDVPAAQLYADLGRRPLGVDLAVILSFVVLWYGLVGGYAAGRVRDAFLPTAPWIAAAAVLGAALAFSLLGVGAGDVWCNVAEFIRLGSGHLSYRVARIPWNQHRALAFIGGTILFCAIAGFRYRQSGRGDMT